MGKEEIKNKRAAIGAVIVTEKKAIKNKEGKI